MLADAGYDVWLANARGTEPSRAHIEWDPNGSKRKEYWSFSWHEIGAYDLPAIIDHILTISKQKQLSYVGHSQGTTSFLVLGSTRPEYNQKLMNVHLMAPVGSLKYSRNYLHKLAARYYDPLKRLIGIFRINKVTLRHTFVLSLFKLFCTNVKQTTSKCKLFLDTVLGSNYVNHVSNQKLFPIELNKIQLIKYAIHFFVRQFCKISLHTLQQELQLDNSYTICK